MTLLKLQQNRLFHLFTITLLLTAFISCEKDPSTFSNYDQITQTSIEGNYKIDFNTSIITGKVKIYFKAQMDGEVIILDTNELTILSVIDSNTGYDLEWKLDTKHSLDSLGTPWFRAWVQAQCWRPLFLGTRHAHAVPPLSLGARLSSPRPETLTPPRTAPHPPTASSRPLTGHSAGRRAAGLSCQPPPAPARCWAAGCLSRSPWGAPACCPHCPRHSVWA